MKRTIINGVELPLEFSGASIINNVAISPDGKRYAHIEHDRTVKICDMPSDGRITVDGMNIRYHRGGISVEGSVTNYHQQGNRMSGVSLSCGSIQIGGGSIHIGRSPLEHDVNQGYEGVQSIHLRKNAGDINLGLSPDTITYVQGKAEAAPTQQGGKLQINGLEGTLLAPTTNTALELDLRTSAGDVRGEVAHKGRIRTSAGTIRLILSAPLTVEADTSAGDIEVRGMINEGRGIYQPPGIHTQGTLILETSAGDVNVEYQHSPKPSAPSSPANEWWRQQ